MKNQFNPSSDEIKYATEEFLKSGGKIKKIIPVYDYKGFKNRDEVDQFLLGL